MLDELSKTLRGAGSARAFEALVECGLLARALPAASAEALEAERLAVHSLLPDPPGVALGLAAWLEIDPLAEGSEQALAASQERAQALRTSRAQRDELRGLWVGRRLLVAAAAPDASRAERIRAARQPRRAAALALARAWSSVARDEVCARRLDELERWIDERSEAELHASPLLHSADLVAAGIAPGPSFGELLERAETCQLNEGWTTREQALAWLERTRRASDA